MNGYLLWSAGIRVTKKSAVRFSELLCTDRVTTIYRREKRVNCAVNNLVARVSKTVLEIMWWQIPQKPYYVID